MKINETPKAITLTRRSPMIERIESESDEMLATVVEFIFLLSLIAILLIIFFAPAKASSAEKWTSANVAAEVAFASLVMMDYGQTKWNIEYGWEARERNPILGRSPSSEKLLTACILSIGLHAAITHVLPREWRTAWQAFSITLEAANVGYNFLDQYSIHGGARLVF